MKPLEKFRRQMFLCADVREASTRLRSFLPPPPTFLNTVIIAVSPV